MINTIESQTAENGNTIELLETGETSCEIHINGKLVFFTSEERAYDDFSDYMKWNSLDPNRYNSGEAGTAAWSQGMYDG